MLHEAKARGTRTQGPRLKRSISSVNLQMLAIATVSPLYVAIPTRWTVLSILLFPMVSLCSRIFQSQNCHSRTGKVGATSGTWIFYRRGSE